MALLSARQKDILRRLGRGGQVLLPADFSTSPDRLTRVVAFQTIVADVQGLYQEGMITLPEKETESVSGGFYVVELYVDAVTSLGKDILAIHGAPDRSS